MFLQWQLLGVSGTPLHCPWVRKDTHICLLMFEMPLTRWKWSWGLKLERRDLKRKCRVKISDDMSSIKCKWMAFVILLFCRRSWGWQEPEDFIVDDSERQRWGGAFKGCARSPELDLGASREASTRLSWPMWKASRAPHKSYSVVFFHCFILKYNYLLWGKKKY